MRRAAAGEAYKAAEGKTKVIELELNVGQ